MRPVSIRRFEQFYLGALLIGLINTMLSWRDSIAAVQADANLARLGSAYLIGTIGFGFGISILLWYLIAHRRSLIAKWITVALFGIGLLSMLWAIAGGSFALTLQQVVGVVATIAQGIAVAMLFRRDATAWLGKRDDVAERFE